jgi:hypothetical protein
MFSLVFYWVIKAASIAEKIHNRKNQGPVSQQMWHDKDPSPLKGPERRA